MHEADIMHHFDVVEAPVALVVAGRDVAFGTRSTAVGMLADKRFVVGDTDVVTVCYGALVAKTAVHSHTLFEFVVVALEQPVASLVAGMYSDKG